MGSPAVTGIFIDAELGVSAKVPDGTRVNSGVCVVLTIVRRHFEPDYTDGCFIRTRVECYRILHQIIYRW